MITCSGFELESSHLHQICLLGFSQLILKIGVIDLDLQSHFDKKWHSTPLLCTDLGWPRGVTRPNMLLLCVWIGWMVCGGLVKLWWWSVEACTEVFNNIVYPKSTHELCTNSNHNYQFNWLYNLLKIYLQIRKSVLITIHRTSGIFLLEAKDDILRVWRSCCKSSQLMI